MEKIVIFGAGGHAKVIIDIIERQNLYEILGIFVDTPGIESLMSYPILGEISECKGYTKGIIAIGDNFGRKLVSEKVIENNPKIEFVSAIHPDATIGKEVHIGAGTVIMAGVIINVHAHIGDHCIINTQASVGHDVVIGNYATAAPGSRIGGNAFIGTLSTISMGANVIQKIKIGNGSLIGAGSTVIRDIPNGVLAYGLPAKVIRQRGIDEKYV